MPDANSQPLRPASPASGRYWPPAAGPVDPVASDAGAADVGHAADREVVAILCEAVANANASLRQEVQTVNRAIARLLERDTLRAEPLPTMASIEPISQIREA
jgi:hypothetical protein